MTRFRPTMDFTSSRTEFSFWALWSAPMLVSTDLRKLTDDKRTILLNEEVIAAAAQLRDVDSILSALSAKQREAEESAAAAAAAATPTGAPPPASPAPPRGDGKGSDNQGDAQTYLRGGR